MSVDSLAHIYVLFFFFNDTATTEIYTLSLHDALPISTPSGSPPGTPRRWPTAGTTWPITGTSTRASGRSPTPTRCWPRRDRKSTRLNSSHANISYAVFCLKKKKKKLLTHYTYLTHSTI